MIRSKMNPYVDLSYDIFRRIIQFGKINETDATKLVRLVFILKSIASGSAQKKPFKVRYFSILKMSLFESKNLNQIQVGRISTLLVVDGRPLWLRTIRSLKSTVR